MKKTIKSNVTPSLPSNSILKLLNKYEARSAHRQLPVIWDRAIGHTVWDKNGNKYIDFTSGIFVTNCGHNVIPFAIIDQLSKYLVYSYNFPTEIRARLLERLIKSTPPFAKKAFLLSTGAEAVECAVKMMRMYTKKQFILSFFGSMHGKTELTEKLKGRYNGNGWAFDALDSIHHLYFPTKNDKFLFGNMEGLNDWKTLIAGIVIESYQGWSARFYPKQYIQDLCKWAKENKVLVCFDEVQGGFWRTGKMFAYEHYGVEPDLICIGKGFGGGMPISAVLGRKKILDVPDDLSSTHSGNPVCCAAALYNLELLEQLDKEELADKEDRLLTFLQIFKTDYKKIIKEVNVKGLLGSIIFRNKKTADRVCNLAMKKGLLLVHTGRESVKIGPSLTISITALMEGILCLEKCLKQIK